MHPPIPADFAQRISGVHGDAGQAWLAGLPDLLDRLAAQWQLTLLPPFELSYNYVAPAVRADGAEVVLKAGVPNPLLACEVAALRLCDGRGMVRLLELDAGGSAFLLERLVPGTLLASLDDAQATAIAAEVMRQIWRPLPADHPFPSIGDWARGFQRLRRRFDGGAGPLPARLVDLAERLYAELLASAAEPVLLHGDLHHYNILAAQRQPWLVIDPQGVAGEPAYEVGALLRNPLLQTLPPASELVRMQARRVDQLTDLLGFDRQRLIGWSVAQAVLSAWWDIEDQTPGAERAIAYAEALAELLMH